MTRGIEAAAAPRAEAAAARWRERVSARLNAVPGLTPERTPDGVRVSGRRLRARWLSDARLRWLGDGL